MKKLIFILVSMAVFTNCDRGYTFDANPGIIEIYVEDASGNNLLDPAFEGNILENAITATFWGQTYKLNEKQTEHPKRPQTRASSPEWYGITTEHPYY